MVTKVHMEALSPTMEEGQLVQWLKSEGDEISSGDILAEIETDKATMEFESFESGTLTPDLGGSATTKEVTDLVINNYRGL